MPKTMETIVTEQTAPTKKTVTWETIRTMNSEELSQYIKALEDEHKADMRALRSWQRNLALIEKKKAE